MKTHDIIQNITHIYAIRHGGIAYPLDERGNKLMYPPDTPLSQEGVKEMKQLGHRLKYQVISFGKIYTSPYARAEQSARILADILNVSEVVANERFLDPWIPGWWGISLREQEELNLRGEDLYMHPRTKDQESYKDYADRVFRGFRKVLKENIGETIAIVSHGDAIRLIVYRLEHPEGEIPNMSILNKFDYLKRGEAWYLVLDGEGRLIEKELITKEGSSNPGEKELRQDSSPIRNERVS